MLSMLLDDQPKLTTLQYDKARNGEVGALIFKMLLHAEAPSSFSRTTVRVSIEVYCHSFGPYLIEYQRSHILKS